jgi:DNA-binding NtrC family response regulator
VKRRTTVLIVGEDAGVRDSAAHLLAGRGHRVLTAGNLGIALGICDLHRPDVVLLDAIVMREPWEEMVRNLAARGERGPRIVLMTGVSAETVSRESGVRLIRAPFRAAELAALVDDAAA